MKTFTVVYLIQRRLEIVYLESSDDANAIKIPDHPEAEIVAVFAGRQHNLKVTK